jgi:hypothetical protein
MDDTITNLLRGLTFTDWMALAAGLALGRRSSALYPANGRRGALDPMKYGRAQMNTP